MESTLTLRGLEIEGNELYLFNPNGSLHKFF